MCQAVFLKSNCKLTCWCNEGYSYELGDFQKQHVGEFLNSPIISYIRESFQNGLEPFGYCERCIAKLSFESQHKQFIVVDVEPSNICNLFCNDCICTAERLSENTPKRTLLPYKYFKKALKELRESQFNVGYIAFCGNGEPVFNPHLPDMIRFARKHFPESFITLDTNANFKPKIGKLLANCGLTQINLALDGVAQQSYEKYRKKGDFNKSMRFTEVLVSEIRATKSVTKPLWKYILFNHNDSNTQITKALCMADDIGIDIIFHLTISNNKSLRKPYELAELVGKDRISYYIDSKYLDKKGPENPTPEHRNLRGNIMKINTNYKTGHEKMRFEEIKANLRHEHNDTLRHWQQIRKRYVYKGRKYSDQEVIDWFMSAPFMEVKTGAYEVSD